MSTPSATISPTIKAVLADLHNQATTRNFTHADDARYFAKTDYWVAGQHRPATFIEQRLIERHLVRLAVQRILAITDENGPAFTISICNSEEERPAPSRDVTKIMSLVMAQDEQDMRVYRQHQDREATFFGAAQLMFGLEDFDVFPESSASIQSVVTEVLDTANAMYEAIAHGH